MSVRRELLEGAADLVDGDRNNQYGDPRQDFQRTAALWNTYLGIEDIEPHDVAAMMALLKLSRIRWSPLKEDSWMDLAGYAACGWHCAYPEDEDDPIPEPHVKYINTVTGDPLYQTIGPDSLSDEGIRFALAAGFRWSEDAFGNHLLVRGG